MINPHKPKYNWKIKVWDILWFVSFIALMVGTYTQETALFAIGIFGCFFVQGLVIEEKIEHLIHHIEVYKRD